MCVVSKENAKIIITKKNFMRVYGYVQNTWWIDYIDRFRKFSAGIRNEIC